MDNITTALHFFVFQIFLPICDTAVSGGSEIDKIMIQAGAELCQAQDKLG